VAIEAVSAFSGEAIRARAGRLYPIGSALGLPRGDFVLNPALRPAPGAPDPKDAAVLVPLVERPGEAGVILTLRTAHLSTHAGQVALPGGRVDPGDADHLATALREAQEEIGLDPGLVKPLGYLDSYVSGTGFRIRPVVGLVSPAAVLHPSPHEVAEVFEVPLSFLMDPANHHRNSRELRGTTVHFYELPWEKHLIWGVTAGIIRGLYEQLFA